MEIKVIFIDDFNSALECQLTDFGKVLSKASEQLSESKMQIKIQDKTNLMESLEIGDDVITFIKKHEVANSDQEYSVVMDRIISFVKEYHDKVILVVDLCLDGSKTPIDKKYIIDLKKTGSKILLTTTWPTFYEQHISQCGKYYEDTNVLFVRRALSADPGEGQKLNWAATDNKEYKFSEQIAELRNNDLKKLVTLLSSADTLNLRYLATILLVAGLE